MITNINNNQKVYVFVAKGWATEKVFCNEKDFFDVYKSFKQEFRIHLFEKPTKLKTLSYKALKTRFQEHPEFKIIKTCGRFSFYY